MAHSAILELLPAWEVPAAGVPAPLAAAPRLRVNLAGWHSLDNAVGIARWDALAQWAAEPNPFWESWSLLSALRALDPDGMVGLLCFEADGELAGLLPLRRTANYYGRQVPHWRSWLHANAFLGTPLVARGLERAFWRELLVWCDANAGSALFLHLAGMAEEGPLHEALQRVLEEQRRPAATVLREERALLRSRLDPEAYLELSLSGKKRKELRRQHRRLAEEGTLTVERTTGTERLAGWTDEFLALERAGWKGESGSALACEPATEALFRASLAGAAQRGKLERLAIRLDDKPLAMLVTFLTPPGAFSFKTAFDEGFARFSPGVLLQRENLELLARPEIEWADSCAAMDHPMIDHFWRQRRHIAAHNLAIGGGARRLLFRALAAYELRTRKPA